MERLFQPVKDLVAAIYDVIYDAAGKVWNLVKPVVLIGLVVDLVTGQLGWIGQILEYYRLALSYTTGASWLVLVIFAVLFLHFFRR